MTQDTRRPWFAMLVIFVAQVLISFVPAIAPVIASEMAPRMGVSPERIGVFTALTYVWAIIGGLLVAPWITWLGPVRSIQIMLLLTGLAALLASFGTLATVLLAAVFLGSALGFPHPAFTAIVGRYAPRRSIGLFLSLRFAAAPVGIALAGIVPFAVVKLGERGTIGVAAVACIVGALVVGRTVVALDWRDGERPSRIDVSSSIREVIADPALRHLACVCLVYAMVQQGFLAYVVLLLVGLGFPLHSAAGLLATSQFVSVVARIGVGHASDHWVTPRGMLAVYGVVMGVACVAAATLSASPSLLLAGCLMGVIAATAMGWAGLMTAQLLRLVPPSRIAHCSSGNQVFIFSGAVLGPSLVAVLLAHGGTYGMAFTGLGLMAIGAGLSMLVHEPSRRADRVETLSDDKL